VGRYLIEDKLEVMMDIWITLKLDNIDQFCCTTIFVLLARAKCLTKNDFSSTLHDLTKELVQHRSTSERLNEPTLLEPIIMANNIQRRFSQVFNFLLQTFSADYFWLFNQKLDVSYCC
jgi:hypothetical protein